MEHKPMQRTCLMADCIKITQRIKITLNYTTIQQTRRLTVSLIHLIRSAVKHLNGCVQII